MKPLVASFVVAAVGCAVAPLPAPTVDAPALTVLDWNVNYGLAGDADAIAAIAEEDADVVVLQRRRRRGSRCCGRRCRSATRTCAFTTKAAPVASSS